MPQHLLGEAIDVVREVRGEAGLTDPGGPTDADQPGVAAIGRRVKEILEEPQLRVAPKHGRLETGRTA